jgi:hypothetical protein
MSLSLQRIAYEDFTSKFEYQNDSLWTEFTFHLDFKIIEPKEKVFMNFRQSFIINSIPFIKNIQVDGLFKLEDFIFDYPLYYLYLENQKYLYWNDTFSLKIRFQFNQTNNIDQFISSVRYWIGGLYRDCKNMQCLPCKEGYFFEKSFDGNFAVCQRR